MSKLIKVLLNGGNGRLGTAITNIASYYGASIHASIGHKEHASDYINLVDVVMDTSTHEATVALAQIAASNNKPLVIATTGHTEEEIDAINRLGETIPIIRSANFSIGVNLLYYLTKMAAKKLPFEYQVDVIEIHHKKKKDSPSGTAKTLVDIILQERKLDESNVIYGREGMNGLRTDKQIGVHSLRTGDVIGDHTLIFAGDGERIEMTHKATSLSIFAKGAIAAANWIIKQKPGLYSMADMLNLKN